MSAAAGCPPGADNLLGPRVETACRPFDFTLLFEDTFFNVVPAVTFLLLLPLQLRQLLKAQTKLNSYALATWKLALLALLFALHIVYLVILSQNSALTTQLSLASGVLAAVAVLGAGILSVVEDQRSARPSDILVLYFSACTLLSLPRLRSLWLLNATTAPKAVWTVIFILTIAVVCAESVRKNRFLLPPYRSLSTEQTVSFWSRGLFVWVLPFFKLGYSKDLNVHDIPQVDTALRGEAAYAKLEASWNQTSGRHRLLRSMFKANLWPFFSAVIPRVCLSCFSFSQPFLIAASVSNLQDRENEDHARYGHALVGAFVLVYMGIAISRALYQRQNFRMTSRIRAALISKIYQDTTALRHTEIKDAAAVTLMGTDVERIIASLSQVHEIWAAVPEISIAVWLLVRRISYAAIVPLIICLISIVGASQIAAHFGPAQIAWIQRVQKRVAVTANMINDMKVVKMLGLSEALYKITAQLRRDELHASERFRKLLVMQILTGNAPALFAPFATFVTYAIIAKVKSDQTLLAAQAFASLSLISLATEPLIMLCQALPNLMQGIACFQHIEDYCIKVKTEATAFPPLPPSQDATAVELGTKGKTSQTKSKSPAFSFNNAGITWSSTDEKSVLHELTLDILPGFTAIIGPVASGKSTLLASIIGETVLKQGFMSPPLSRVAFCPQTPWIIDDTVRCNITGYGDFDQDWYDFTISSCGLLDDIKRFPLGDKFLCGSKGASLSGGQRQRVALARAVYSRLPIVILDDIMSGFDSKTTGNILEKLFSQNGYFRKAGISVILATHSHRVLPFMDSVVVLEHGTVVEVKPYDKIKAPAPKSASDDEADSEQSNEVNDDSTTNVQGDAPSVLEDPEIELEKDSLRRRGGSWSVYSYYCRSAGVVPLVLWVGFTFVGAVTATYTAVWIQQWTKANEQHPNEQLGLYLGIYTMLVVLALLAVAGECWVFFIKIISETALKLHDDLLRATINAPFYFFQTTDAGTITNRFSQDMDLIDMTLPAHAVTFTTGTASCIVQLIFICIVGKYLAATVPALICVLFVVQRYYLRTSRQLRLMDIEAKAPIYKVFLETTEGVAPIRSFGWSTAFHKRQDYVLNISQRPLYMLACIQQWLALVLDLIVGGLAVVITASATADTSAISAGDLGVALVLVLQFSTLLTQSVQNWTRLETSIGAVARVQQFLRDTPPEAHGTETLPTNFPESGTICYNNVTASYG
ncbi:hypothetical protein VHEMI08233 [[Torrubiella] hemipterigena]|nr:hypothetical protein VHEMI08233 [[Torrubiella] hemipterigena]